jgi:four helix bundle protein
MEEKKIQKSIYIKLSDAEAEAGETQVWLRFAEKCGYLEDEARTELDTAYRAIIAQIISMIDNADKWTFSGKG